MKAAVAIAAGLALAACSSEPRPSQADRLNASGADAYAAGRPRTAVARFSAAAEASGAIDDRASLSRDLHNRGLALLATGETEAGCADLAESLRLAGNARASADDRLRTRLALAGGLAALGRTADAEACLGEAMAIEGSSGLRARVLSSRAALALRRDDLAAAETDLTAAAGLADDDGGRGAVAVNRGHLAMRAGDPGAARTAYNAAIDAFRRSGEHAGLAAALEGLARAAEAAGDRAQAAQAWRRAAQVPYGGPAARDRRLAEATRLESR